MTEPIPYIDDPVLGELPVFPLPSTVLFPGTDLPLHVFEPRYRALVEHALAGHRAMAVGLLEPGYEARYFGRPPVFDVAGAGIIVAEERLPDGRWNILLRGTDRVRAVEEAPPVEPFRVFRYERLTDTWDGADLSEAERTLRSLVLRLGDAVPDVRDPLTRVLARVHGGGELADQVACRVIPDALRRQAVLEELEVGRRLAMVVEEVAGILLRVDRCCRASRDEVN